MLDPVSFFVPTKPVTQGSKRVARGRVLESSRGHKAWRSAATMLARMAWRGREPLDVAAKLIVTFYVPPPKSAKLFDLPAKSGGDTDKLIRAIGDSLEAAGVLTNDRRITDIDARRRFAFPGQPVGAEIMIGAMG